MSRLGPCPHFTGDRAVAGKGLQAGASFPGFGPPGKGEQPLLPWAGVYRVSPSGGRGRDMLGTCRSEAELGSIGSFLQPRTSHSHLPPQVSCDLPASSTHPAVSGDLVPQACGHLPSPVPRKGGLPCSPAPMAGSTVPYSDSSLCLPLPGHRWPRWGCPVPLIGPWALPLLVLEQGEPEAGSSGSYLSPHQVLMEEPSLCSIYRHGINWCAVNLFFLKRDFHTGESF